MTFDQLYSREGAVALDARFVEDLRTNDAALHNRLVTARANPDALPDKEHSQLIIDLAPHLEDFIAGLFSIRAPLTALKEKHFALAPLYSCKRLFIQRKAAKAIKPEEAEKLDGAALEKQLLEYFSAAKALPLQGGGLGGGQSSGGGPSHASPSISITTTFRKIAPEIISNARDLRKNMTEAEKKLWHHLSRNQLEGLRFHRQHPIGRYITDFCCTTKKLIIEVDGGQHSEPKKYDDERTAYLEQQGYRIVRFWNNEVLGNMEGVYATIVEALHAPSAEDRMTPTQPSPLQGEGFDLAFARHVMRWLDAADAHKDQLDAALQYAAWALHSEAGKHKHADGILFKAPRKLDPLHLIPLATELRHGVTMLKIPAHHERARTGFALTDDGGTLEKALDEANYCIWCHNQGKDSCSKGFRIQDSGFKKEISPDPRPPTPDPFKRNMLGIPLAGCPLEEKISEMNFLKSEGIPIGALATIVIDNPMCAGTGHRICNDCMKSCIYQKQEPVNIPQAETRSLRDILELPYGFEIYSLLTRWNPLNLHRPVPKPDSGHKILVAGMGPAGYTLAHHLMNDGHTVVGIDGLKIEPLPQDISGVTALGERVPFAPIRDIATLFERLDERSLAGFGGVAEYGITVRWDKNFLKVIRLLLERRSQFALLGGVRMGGTITIPSAWELGFDHIALCMGAGRPTLIDMPNGIARGVRAASDFLMALQLTGAGKKDSIANLQLRLPVVVIGGGLTAMDTATEALAYYPVQVEKFLARYETLAALKGEAGVREGWSEEETIIADEFIAHAHALRMERQKSQPEMLKLLKEWGGVTLAYRRHLTDAPSYRLNHEEVEKALEEGIFIAEGLEPLRVETDRYGHAQAVVFKDSGFRIQDSGNKEASPESRIPHPESSLPARAVLIAAGTNPNTVLAREEAHVRMHGKFFQAVDENGEPVIPEAVAKPNVPQVLMSMEPDGRAVSFFGDLHPSFNGNVVKAMGSAKQGYPVVSRILAKKRGRGSGVGGQEFLRRMNALLRATIDDVIRLTPTIVEVIVKAPLAAREFQPGQFYRLQNFEANALKIQDSGFRIQEKTPASLNPESRILTTTLAMEGLAMTGAWVDKDQGLLSTIVLEMGGSSNLCAQLKKGEPVALMGPTGSPTEIPADKTLLLIGGGLGNAVLFSIGKAARAKGSKVLYFAGYKKAADRYKTAEIEAAADVIVWCCDSETLPAQRPQDKSFSGNIVEAIAAYAQGKLGATSLAPQDADHLIAIGSSGMMAAVARARTGILAPHLKPGHTAVASVNSPMQCMMKEICAQCLQQQVDPETGCVRYVYSCFNQDQELDRVSFPFLEERLRQNSVQEHVTAQWIDLCLTALGLRQKAA